MLIILVVSTVFNFIFGILIESNKKKSILGIGIIINIVFLGFFKYLNFFTESVISLLNMIGFEVSFTTLNILLPIGISFYTFQAISYLIDISKSEINASKDFIAFSIYMGFFAKMIAGPIEKAGNFLPQLQKKRNFGEIKFSKSFQLLLIGYFKKKVIADIISMKIADIYSNPNEFDSIMSLICVILYSLQIYADFSGYSSMARGTALLFGINLNINFNQPYFSKNPQEFWRRWHISLSTWVRDYLYIGLGGNRKGKSRTYFNLIISMTIIGLWHGAGFNYIVWGFLHGIYLSIHRLFSNSNKRNKTESDLINYVREPKEQIKGHDNEHTIKMEKFHIFIKNLISKFITFSSITLAWIFFRAPTLIIAIEIIKNIFSFNFATVSSFGDLLYLDIFKILIFSSLLLYIFDYFQNKYQQHEIFEKWSYIIQGIVYFAIILSLIIFNIEFSAPFIYEGY